MCPKLELYNVTAFHLYRAPSLCFSPSGAVVVVVWWCGVVWWWCGDGGVMVVWWWCGVMVVWCGGVW